MRTNLFVTVGFPGSGKTYFSEKFAKHERVVHLNSDFFRSHMFPGSVHSEEINVKVFDLIDSLAFHTLENGQSVIIDTNATRKIYRDRYREIASNTGADCIVIIFKTPIDIAKQRLKNRVTDDPIKSKFYKIVSTDTLHKLIEETEEPTDNEKIIILDGTKTFEENIVEFKQQYETLL